MSLPCQVFLEMPPQLLSEVHLHRRPQASQACFFFFFFLDSFVEQVLIIVFYFVPSQLRMLSLIKLAQQCLVLLIADFLLPLKSRDRKQVQ